MRRRRRRNGKTHRVQWLIHGHTHRPAVHELSANDQPAFRVVLGAWHREGSMVKSRAGQRWVNRLPL